MTQPYDPYGIGFGQRPVLGGLMPGLPELAGLPLGAPPKVQEEFAGFVPQAPVGPAIAQGETRDPMSGLILPTTIAAPPPKPTLPASAPRTPGGVPTSEIPAPKAGVGAGRGGVSAAQKGLLESYGKLEEAQKLAGAGEREKLEAIAKGQELEAAGAITTAEKLEAIQAKKDAYNNAMQDELSRDLAEIKNAQVDPRHVINTMTAPEKFQTTAAMLLGGFAAALKGGGPNRAIEDFNRRVERDIDLQREAIQGKKEALATKRGLYAANLAKYGDDERATLATRAQYAAATQAQVARLATLSGTKSVQANADMAIGLLDQEQKKLRLGFEKENAAAAAAQASAVPKMIEKLKVDPDRYVETTDSTGQKVTGYAPDKETARDVRKGTLAVKDVLAGLDQIEALVERNKDAKVPWSTTSQQIKSITQELVPKFNAMSGAGAPSESERAGMIEMIGDPSTWDYRKGGLAVTRQLRARTAMAGDRILQANNISLVDRENIKQGGLVIPVARERGQMYEPTARPTASIEELGGKKVTPK